MCRRRTGTVRYGFRVVWLSDASNFRYVLVFTVKLAPVGAYMKHVVSGTLVESSISHLLHTNKGISNQKVNCTTIKYVSCDASTQQEHATTFAKPTDQSSLRGSRLLYKSHSPSPRIHPSIQPTNQANSFPSYVTDSLSLVLCITPRSFVRSFVRWEGT